MGGGGGGKLHKIIIQVYVKRKLTAKKRGPCCIIKLSKTRTCPVNRFHANIIDNRREQNTVKGRALNFHKNRAVSLRKVCIFFPFDSSGG
jgi:hypothetical protein